MLNIKAAINGYGNGYFTPRDTTAYDEGLFEVSSDRRDDRWLKWDAFINLKPLGGLWTSPLTEGDWSHTPWTRFVEHELERVVYPSHLVKAGKNARIAVMNSLEDFVDLSRRFPHPVLRAQAFSVEEMMRGDVDALHVTGKAINDANYDVSGTLFGRMGRWDAESIFWLRLDNAEISAQTYDIGRFRVA